ncbi:TRAP transporter small permease [Azospirillum sp. RWY-5-1]|uniref:TRAP transporter small permease protein n=1 Tax=Azospirillum oleiclasticum TaxID=2735135 RepID=A0ABX2TLC1_9PROT|nr:TRAP transporter small permease [Azospirillum oleiclasticum]NYZ17281.1 TRAP transporter small permease [Azospirillum oleiclasticum]NYZ23435.1 TRAP transporter small permease [Azospirillum oleiclasticum]
MSSDLLEAGLETAPPKTRVPVTIERAAAALAMAGLCVISFANVAVRYLTDVSFAFTEEYSIFLMVVMTFFGASVAVAADRHIRITFLVDRLPRSVRRVTETVVWTAALVMFGFLAWYGGRLTYDQWRFEETSPALGNPQWLYTVWMPALSVVVALRVVGRIVDALRGNR